jgi:arylsulfatase
MEKLAEWKALDNTLVIFMTDNGSSRIRGTLNGKSVSLFNAHFKSGKGTPYEGGTHVPAFWYWKGVLGEGVDVDALTSHFDLYKTFCDLAGVTLPATMQELDGRSLLPLLKDPKADWPDQERFVHCGRWDSGQRDTFKFKNFAVRTEQWRFVNNKELYDISKDPFETTNVAGEHADVITKLRQSYDQWWESVLPLMVNEDLPSVSQKNQPLAIRYYKQLKEKGIPEWAPEKY